MLKVWTRPGIYLQPLLHALCFFLCVPPLLHAPRPCARLSPAPPSTTLCQGRDVLVVASWIPASEIVSECKKGAKENR